MAKMSNQTKIIMVLAVLLVISLGFIGWNYYSAYKTTQQNELLQQGAQIGYQQAIVDVASMAVQCQEVPLVVGNQTVNVVAVGCLQQPAQ